MKVKNEYSGESAIIIGDSKVRHLDAEMTDKTHIRTVWRSGAELNNHHITRELDRHIMRYNNPIVLLWFGTCEITRFVGPEVGGRKKYIDLVLNFSGHCKSFNHKIYRIQATMHKK